MKFELKPLSSEAVPRALAKAERYRLLNEQREAESICLDALEREPDNQEALKMLLLALTDQFGQEEVPSTIAEASKIVARLRDDYDRAYYTGIIYERRAKVLVQDTGSALEWLGVVTRSYEKAENNPSPRNDYALL